MATEDIDAIVFDFDGVIAESVSIKGDAFVKLYEAEEEHIRNKVLAYHNENGGVSRYDKIRHYEEQLCGRTVDEQGIEKLAQAFSDIVEELVVTSPAVPGAVEFLTAHKDAVPFYVASATPQSELERIIERRDLSHFFNGVYGSPQKKDEHIKGILEFNEYDPDKVYMIGDAITDYNAAVANGVKFIGRVPEGHKSPFPEGTKEIRDLTELDAALGLG